ncbi:hypothetical protein M758_7G102800 [Ceratodon purpureus]|nr:hypothetical protein M758_7G102800 [Ceratodon purpureus]
MSEAQRENERKVGRNSTSDSSAQGSSGKRQSAQRQVVEEGAANLVRVPTPPKSRMTPPETGQTTATSDTETQEIEEELAKTKILIARLKRQQQVAISEAEDIRTEIRAIKARCRGNPR